MWNHPDSDKLLCEQVDVGEGVLRSIGSGIRAFHSAEEIQGRLVCVMCNLKPKKLAGYPSNGMLLCASVKDHSKGALIDPPEGSEVGERVCFAGIDSNPAAPNQVHKKKMLETVLPVCLIGNWECSTSTRTVKAFVALKKFLFLHRGEFVPVKVFQMNWYLMIFVRVIISYILLLK